MGTVKAPQFLKEQNLDVIIYVFLVFYFNHK